MLYQNIKIKIKLKNSIKRISRLTLEFKSLANSSNYLNIFISFIIIYFLDAAI